MVTQAQLDAMNQQMGLSPSIQTQAPQQSSYSGSSSSSSYQSNKNPYQQQRPSQAPTIQTGPPTIVQTPYGGVSTATPERYAKQSPNIQLQQMAQNVQFKDTYSDKTKKRDYISLASKPTFVKDFDTSQYPVRDINLDFTPLKTISKEQQQVRDWTKLDTETPSLVQEQRLYNDQGTLSPQTRERAGELITQKKELEQAERDRVWDENLGKYVEKDIVVGGTKVATGYGLTAVGAGLSEVGVGVPLYIAGQYLKGSGMKQLAGSDTGKRLNEQISPATEWIYEKSENRNREDFNRELQQWNRLTEEQKQTYTTGSKYEKAIKSGITSYDDYMGSPESKSWTERLSDKAEQFIAEDPVKAAAEAYNIKQILGTGKPTTDVTMKVTDKVAKVLGDGKVTKFVTKMGVDIAEYDLQRRAGEYSTGSTLSTENKRKIENYDSSYNELQDMTYKAMRDQSTADTQKYGMIQGGFYDLVSPASPSEQIFEDSFRNMAKEKGWSETKTNEMLSVVKDDILTESQMWKLYRLLRPESKANVVVGTDISKSMARRGYTTAEEYLKNKPKEFAKDYFMGSSGEGTQTWNVGLDYYGYSKEDIKSGKYDQGSTPIFAGKEGGFEGIPIPNKIGTFLFSKEILPGRTWVEGTPEYDSKLDKSIPVSDISRSDYNKLSEEEKLSQNYNIKEYNSLKDSSIPIKNISLKDYTNLSDEEKVSSNYNVISEDGRTQLVGFTQPGEIVGYTTPETESRYVYHAGRIITTPVVSLISGLSGKYFNQWIEGPLTRFGMSKSKTITTPSKTVINKDQSISFDVIPDRQIGTGIKKTSTGTARVAGEVLDLYTESGGDVLSTIESGLGKNKRKNIMSFDDMVPKRTKARTLVGSSLFSPSPSATGGNTVSYSVNQAPVISQSMTDVNALSDATSDVNALSDAISSSSSNVFTDTTSSSMALSEALADSTAQSESTSDVPSTVNTPPFFVFPPIGGGGDGTGYDTPTRSGGRKRSWVRTNPFKDYATPWVQRKIQGNFLPQKSNVFNMLGTGSSSATPQTIFGSGKKDLSRFM